MSNVRNNGIVGHATMQLLIIIAVFGTRDGTKTFDHVSVKMDDGQLIFMI